MMEPLPHALAIDSHLHVWSDDTITYPWQPVPGMSQEMLPGSLEHLLQVQAACGVAGAVLVQPGNYGYDHRYLLDCCHRYPGRFVGVCLVDPLAADAAEQLRRMVAQEGIAGLRLRPLGTPHNWRWLTSAGQDELWQMAAALSVPISLLAWPEQLTAVGEMADRHPACRVIIDHLGRQRKEESPAYPGSAPLFALARRENVYVKVSALAVASAQPYPFTDATALVRRLHGEFGAERLMWGTDFPYVQQHEGYARALQLLDHFDFISERERQWLLWRTVASLYPFDLAANDGERSPQTGRRM